jgi:4-aminobutyrate aminotransferase
VIVFQGGFHGRTIGAGSMTTAKYVYRAGFQPTMPGVYVAPFPYCVRCSVGCASNGKFNLNNCCNNPLFELKQLLKQQVHGDEVAAIVVEPVQGEGGYIVPPAGFLQGVRQLCDEIGALMVCDEVQSGFGRTGTYFAHEQFGIVPDIMVVAKGIANGFPLSAIVTRPEIMSRAKPGSIGGTVTNKTKQNEFLHVSIVSRHLDSFPIYNCY